MLLFYLPIIIFDALLETNVKEDSNYVVLSERFDATLEEIAEYLD